MNTYCMFCNRKPKGNVEEGKEIICALCVTVLLSYSQEELISGYIYARKLGFDKKAEALESFIEKERLDAFKSNGLLNGNRDNGVHGNNKHKPTKKLKEQPKHAIHKGKSKTKNVLPSRRSGVVKK